MQILELEINKLKPDPNQPRKSFNPERLQELAQSFKSTGIINPIEVDKNNVIVTGEYRWRAAKEAGLRTVPCKVVEVNKDERFLRQMVENVQHTDMTPWETAVALKKLLNLASTRGNKISKWGGNNNEGYSELATRIGKSTEFVREHLYLVQKASQPIQKAVRSGKIPISVTRAITRAPKEHQKAIEKKVLAGEFVSHRAGLSVVSALQREQDNPEKINAILRHDYSKYKTSEDVGMAVRQISPNLADLVNASFEPTKQLAFIVNELEKWLEENPKQSIGALHIATVAINLESAKESINNWIKEKA